MNKLLFIAALMLSLISCTPELGEDEDDFRMNGNGSSSSYSYIFYNQSRYEVKVTIGSSTKTVRVGSSNSFYTYSSSERVVYSPSSKVKPRDSRMNPVTFINK